MNDLDFLFFLIPGLVLSIGAVTLWLTLRAHRRFRREMFGEENVPLFAAFFPTSNAGLRHHSSGHWDGGHIDHGGTHHSSGSPHTDDHSSHTEYSGHGPSYSGHGPSHDHGSSSYDSSSSSDWGSSSSSSSDSGSSSW